jgi:methionine aminopeptidase
MDVTKQVLDTAIAKAAPNVKWSHVASEMQDHAESAGQRCKTMRSLPGFRW